MKKLNSLNLGKSLNREEMRTVNGGLANDPYCDCGGGGAVLTFCGCEAFCKGECKGVAV